MTSWANLINKEALLLEHPLYILYLNEKKDEFAFLIEARLVQTLPFL